MTCLPETPLDPPKSRDHQRDVPRLDTNYGGMGGLQERTFEALFLSLGHAERTLTQINRFSFENQSGRYTVWK